MLQLLYISSVTRAASDELVGEILTTSRRNNAAAGVTGLLLYDGKRFLQALEGSETAVSTTYERIKRDTRHRGIVLLSSKIVETRSFGEWSMAAEKIAQAAGTTIPVLVDQLTARVADANTREIIRGFARVRAAA
ncbi:BLUF domain-containing protein [Sphingomonas sp. AP4-R1]|uniref:BLUF domain-containing protein n=1 Tax=Sphingomonas sp. AP4-R1 TaxID=2735134 RepID=UPI0014932F77|nr:BLUF domain-containing protein [Sphingomonas sp. AP4-R1]QJU60314.1 BLUF domain-containing protein [Sphingomonas sp. AP4-R1]